MVLLVFLTIFSASFAIAAQKEINTSNEVQQKNMAGSLYWDYDANLLEKQIAEKGWGQFDSYEIAIDIYDQPLNSINDSGSLSETRTKNKIFSYVEKTGVLLILRFHDGQVKFFGPYDTKEAFKEELIPYFNRQITDGRMNQEEVDTIMLSYERPESMFRRRDIITKDQVNTAFYQDKIDSSWYYLESQTYYQNLGFNYRHIKAVGRDTVKTPDVPSQIDGYDLVIHFDLPDDIKDTSPLVKGEVGYLGPYKTKAELLTHATIYLQDQVALKKLVQEEANNILAQLKKEKTASELLIEEIGRPNTAWYKARMGEDRTFHIRMYRYNQHGNFIEKTNDSYHVNSVYSKSEQPETYDGYALDIEFKNDSTVSIGPYNTKEEFVSKTAFYLQEQVLHKKLAQENMNMILNEIKE